MARKDPFKNFTIAVSPEIKERIDLAKQNGLLVNQIVKNYLIEVLDKYEKNGFKLK